MPCGSSSAWPQWTADSESDQASQHTDSAEESELHLQLQAQGSGLAALGASGYADDT